MEEKIEKILIENDKDVYKIIEKINNLGLTPEEKDEIIYKIIELGYEITKWSPSFLKKFKYIKYSIEKGNINSLYAIEVEKLTEQEEKDLHPIIKKIIENGFYKNNNDYYFMPEIMKKKSYIKYGIENDQLLYLIKPIELIFSEKEQEEIIKKEIDKGYEIDYITPNLLKKYKYLKYALEKGQTETLKFFDIKSMTEEEKQELDPIIMNLIDNGYKDLPPILIQNKYLKRLIQNGNIDIINRINMDYSLTEEEQEEIIKLAIDNGYQINYSLSPEIMKQYKYLKYAIEHGQANIINQIYIKELLEHEDLIKLAIDHGYEINYYSPETVIQYKYLKYAIEHGQVNAIFQFKNAKTITEEEKEELIKLAIDHGHRLTNGFPMVKNKFECVKYAIEKGQSDATYYLLKEEKFDNVEQEEIDSLILKGIKEGYKVNTYNYNKKLEKFKFLKEIIKNEQGEMLSHLKIEELTKEELEELKDLIYIAIDNGYKLGYYSPEIIRQYKYIKYAIEHGQGQALGCLSLESLTDLEKQDLENLIHKAIDNGYEIKYSSPETLKQYKYIKYAIEKGQGETLRYLNIENLTDLEKQGLEDLIKKAIDNGYRLTEESLETIKQYKYIKYAIEHGQGSALNYLEFEILEEQEKQELEDLIYVAIKNGYKIGYYSPEIIKQYKYIKYAIEHGQGEALWKLDIEQLTDLEKLNLENLIYKAIDNGYGIEHNSPKIIKQYKYIKHAIEHGQVEKINLIEVDKLTKEEQENLDELIYKAIDNGYGIKYNSPEIVKQYKYIEYAVEKKETNGSNMCI